MEMYMEDGKEHTWNLHPTINGVTFTVNNQKIIIIKLRPRDNETKVEVLKIIFFLHFL